MEHNCKILENFAYSIMFRACINYLKETTVLEAEILSYNATWLAVGQNMQNSKSTIYFPLC